MSGPTFVEAFRAALLELVTAHPENYLMQGATPAQYAETVGGRLGALMTMDGNVDRILHTTPAFRLACKRLGIPHTRKAINARLQQDGSHQPIAGSRAL